MPTSLQAPLASRRFPLGASALPHYDIAIVGGGPVGSLCALAHARKGARVALLEANPKAAQRLAGEWLHPPAVRMLQSVGVSLEGRPGFSPGKGFVVFPEDRSEPIQLPYPAGAAGLVFEHSALVSCLHDTVENEPGIDIYRHARARAIEEEGIVFSFDGAERLLQAGRIVGADGRASIVRQSLGLRAERMTCSRMVGVVAEGVKLQHEEFGYVVLGAPGPMLTVPLGEGRVRIIADMPLELWTPRDRIGVLLESYAGYLPEDLRSAFVDALRAGRFQAAANELRPRMTYGSSRRVLIGDAAGHYHPMTAAGMTLGFGDALALAEGKNFTEFANRRLKETRAPQLLAMGLYEVFRDHRLESSVLRQAVYRNWRASKLVRTRTMRLLACEDASVTRLGVAFSATVATGVVGELGMKNGILTWRRARAMVRTLALRLVWMVRGVRELENARSSGGADELSALDKLSGAFLVSMQEHSGVAETVRPNDQAPVEAASGLDLAAKRLLDLQREDGAWEGEMTWCPMLAAQYALLHYVIGRQIEPGRRRLLLRQFEQTRLDGGLWGLHEHARASLFVTTLVYVAARLLGAGPDDPLVKPAREFLQEEGVLNIPSWGKFWLALLNLYDWRGVNAMLPELWRLPRRLPLHPSNWYCHTRLIYMAMATIYSRRFQVAADPLIESLRNELYPEGFARVNFAAGRNRLREADLFARPGRWLRAGYALTRIYERFHGKRLRARCREELVERIRWELRSSSHTSISPVSGFLNILALWLRDPEDGDFHKAVEGLEGWIWEDEENGTRITGARSASWDTGFSLQALATIPGRDGVHQALRKGSDFLRGQQIPVSFDGFGEAYRNDPRGGWCFAGEWHGWPVTDCTAEAVTGLIAAGPGEVDEKRLGEAIGFMLRGQNRDGGFGSYEAKRSGISLEWLNPAEMFGESMTEHSYVECTASCLAALAACKRRYPQVVDGTAIESMSRANAWLRRTQAHDGSWRGVWGVQFIYGVMFGIRGLLAGGASPRDPALRLAGHWLLDRQRSDGGWGEHHSGCLSGAYVAHEQSQVIQTAWALIALLEAGDSHWTAISRGVRFLLDAQDEEGGWPKQDMAGVFFRTALLDYELYRQYFPLHALGLYERRRRARRAETG